MEMIDLMPPGLYEAVIKDVDDETANPALISGRYLFHLEPRSLDDIRKLGGNSLEDDLKFAAAERVSIINRRLYETYVGPWVRSVTPPAFGEWSRKMHPNRMRFAIFSDENPAMRFVAEQADQIRQQRSAASDDNLFSAAEKTLTASVRATVTAMGAARDALTEQLFHTTYGSPFLQALVGLDSKGVQDARKPEREALREQARARRRADLETRFEAGGPVEAALRAAIYIRRGEGGADERSFAMLKALHDAQPPGRPRSMAQLKEVLREQSLLLRLDEARAFEAIRGLLPRDSDDRARTLRAVQRLASAQGELSDEGLRRLADVEKLFAVRKSVKDVKEDADARA
jgi:hypothetical protein